MAGLSALDAASGPGNSAKTAHLATASSRLQLMKVSFFVIRCFMVDFLSWIDVHRVQ
jgi:hypothetical protein